MGLWQFTEPLQARFSLAGWHGDVGVKSPGTGVHLALGLAAPSLFALAVRVHEGDSGQDLELVEAYARGDDLIATYAQPARGSIRPQIYWTPRSLEGGILIDLQVLVQTSLLESQPRTRVECRLPGRLLEPLVGGASRTPEPTGTPETPGNPEWRIVENPPWSFVMMGHPADGGQLQATSTGPLVSCWTDLFTVEPLEKGVIQRGRVRFAALLGDGAAQRAWELCREFVASPPPLAV